jgi:hypothetical protein
VSIPGLDALDFQERASFVMGFPDDVPHDHVTSVHGRVGWPSPDVPAALITIAGTGLNFM